MFGNCCKLPLILPSLKYQRQANDYLTTKYVQRVMAIMTESIEIFFTFHNSRDKMESCEQHIGDELPKSNIIHMHIAHALTAPTKVKWPSIQFGTLFFLENL